MMDFLARGWGGLVSLILVAPWVIMIVVPVLFIIVAPASVTLFRLFGKKKVADSRASKPPRILVVDDEESSVLSLLSILSKNMALIHFVSSPEAMVKELKEYDFDLIFVDRLMPNMDGDRALTIADQASTRNRVTPVVFFTNAENDLRLPEMVHYSLMGVWGKQLPYQNLDHKVGSALQSVNRGALA